MTEIDISTRIVVFSTAHPPPELVNKSPSIYTNTFSCPLPFPVESRTNFTSLALSPDGVLLIGVNEDGDALLISLLGQVVLGSYRFPKRVTAVEFSPDGAKFAVLQQNLIFVFKAPGRKRQFNPFQVRIYDYSACDVLFCLLMLVSWDAV